MEKAQKEGVFGQKGAEKGKNRGKKEEKGYLEEWKGLEEKFGKMATGKKLKKVSRKELEREKEALRRFDEEALGGIWGGRIKEKIRMYSPAE